MNMQFEEWAKTQPLSLERACANGVTYRFDETEYAWLAWKEATRLAERAAREEQRDIAAERSWKDRQGDEYGSY
jgi:hypothetical protein